MVSGKGDITIFDRYDTCIIVEDVFYVHGMKCNLLSVVELEDKNYKLNLRINYVQFSIIHPIDIWFLRLKGQWIGFIILQGGVIYQN